MNRRAFFGALAGAPVAIVVPAKAPSIETVTLKIDMAEVHDEIRKGHAAVLSEIHRHGWPVERSRRVLATS